MRMQDRLTLPLDHEGPTNHAFDPFPDAALNASVPARFGHIASFFGSRIAVSDNTRSFTYSQLAGLAAGIAAALPVRVAEPTRVGIMLGHEARFPAAMLGVLA